MSQMVATSDRWRDEVMARSLGGHRARHAGTTSMGSTTCRLLAVWAGAAPRRPATASTPWRRHHGPQRGMGRAEAPPNVPLPAPRLGRRRGWPAARWRRAMRWASSCTMPRPGRVKGVAYGVAGTRNSGRGVFGGYPGAPSVLMHYEGTHVAEELALGRAPVDLDALGGQARVLPYSTSTSSSPTSSSCAAPMAEALVTRLIETPASSSPTCSRAWCHPMWRNPSMELRSTKAPWIVRRPSVSARRCAANGEAMEAVPSRTARHPMASSNGCTRSPPASRSRRARRPDGSAAPNAAGSSVPLARIGRAAPLR